MPEDRSSDNTGSPASEKAAPRRRWLFALPGFAWVALGIAWLIVELTGFKGRAEPWNIVIGILSLALGIVFLIGWPRGRRSASETIR